MITKIIKFDPFQYLGEQINHALDHVRQMTEENYEPLKEEVDHLSNDLIEYVDKNLLNDKSDHSDLISMTKSSI